MTPATSIPISWHTLAATTPLSPVMIFTSTPSWDSWATAAPASALGRSAKVRKPIRVSWRSSPVVIAEVPAGRSRVATATTRSPSAKSLSNVLCAPSGRAGHLAKTASGAPLVMSSGPPSGRATSTEHICRSWSNGSIPRRR